MTQIDVSSVLRQARRGETSFAVVDVETTGFSPRLNDRVVEVAVVHTDADGVETGRWTTLLNPERDLGPTHIHGLTGADVLDAPTFGDIAGDLATLMHDRVVVAHNAKFDLEFLGSEFARAGGTKVAFAALCTLGLSRSYGRTGGGKLAHCLAAEGIAADASHTALGDATATAQLLSTYLRRASDSGVTDLGALGCEPVELPGSSWISWPPTGRARPRSQRATPSFEIPLLSQLVRHLPAFQLVSSPAAASVDAYLDLLGRAIEDRHVTAAEAQALCETALAWGLGGSDLRSAHRLYLVALAATALADGVVTSLEADDLHSVALALGLGPLDVRLAMEEARVASETFGAADDDLRGQSVCFTGELHRLIDGRPMSRDHAQTLARAAGLIVQNGVTKSLDLLVTADPDSLSGKARTARRYGTRIVSEQGFWKLLESNQPS